MGKSKKRENKKMEVKVQPRKEAQPLRELKSGFKVLKIEMPPIKIYDSLTSKTTKNVNISHYIYFKKHESNKEDEETPNGYTLFVCNLPVDTTIAHINHIFKSCGHVVTLKINKSKDLIIENSEQEIILEDEEMDSVFGRETYTNGVSAHIVFAEEDAIEKALSMKQHIRVWKAEPLLEDEEMEEEVEKKSDDEDEKLDFEQETGTMPIGYKKWMQQYKYIRPRPKALKTRVDNYMVNFNRMEEIERLQLDKPIVDADGFTLVTRKSRRNTNSGNDGASVTAARYEEIKDLKPKNKELQNFYRFQIKEKKRNELAELRKKFQEDKKRIQELRSSRRFKPY